MTTRVVVSGLVGVATPRDGIRYQDADAPLDQREAELAGATILPIVEREPRKGDTVLVTFQARSLGVQYGLQSVEVQGAMYVLPAEAVLHVLVDHAEDPTRMTLQQLRALEVEGREVQDSDLEVWRYDGDTGVWHQLSRCQAPHKELMVRSTQRLHQLGSPLTEVKQ